jgi:hypothetical protein
LNSEEDFSTREVTATVRLLDLKKNTIHAGAVDRLSSFDTAIPGRRYKVAALTFLCVAGYCLLV